MTRAGLYVRVSTPEQTVENQERGLRQWAERLGLAVVAVYADTASGARSDRAALAAVLAGAHRREFDVLLLWGRSIVSLVRASGATARYNLEQLRAAGGRVMSHQDPWLDTGGPVGDLLVAVFAWVAKQERERIGEGVRAGQKRARAAGVRFGRPARTVDLEDLRRRREAGQPWRVIARALRIPKRTLIRHAKAGQKSQAGSAPEQPVSTRMPRSKQWGVANVETFGPGRAPGQSRLPAARATWRGRPSARATRPTGPSRGPALPENILAQAYREHPRDGLIVRTLFEDRAPGERVGPPRGRQRRLP